MLACELVSGGAGTTGICGWPFVIGEGVWYTSCELTDVAVRGGCPNDEVVVVCVIGVEKGEERAYGSTRPGVPSARTKPSSSKSESRVRLDFGSLRRRRRRHQKQRKSRAARRARPTTPPTTPPTMAATLVLPPFEGVSEAVATGVEEGSGVGEVSGACVC
jgi:hypothetical protein